MLKQLFVTKYFLYISNIVKSVEIQIAKPVLFLGHIPTINCMCDESQTTYNRHCNLSALTIYFHFHLKKRNLRNDTANDQLLFCNLSSFSHDTLVIRTFILIHDASEMFFFSLKFRLPRSKTFLFLGACLLVERCVYCVICLWF